MILDANLHANVAILKRIPANYDLPYNDGSYIDKSSRFYKDLVKKDKKNYEYLKKYIDNGTALEIEGIDFPRRDGGIIDSMKSFTIKVWDNKEREYYTFNATSEQDNIAVKNHEYYVCDFQWY